MKSPLVVITGPTAVGKTKLAVHVANRINAEIINADSRQVYRQMDIGTGKDLSDYTIDDKQIPFHLIDICDPGYQYNIKEYQQDFSQVYEDLQAAEKNMVLCGGSGLYVESAIEGNPYAFVPVNEAMRKELADFSKSRIAARIEPNIKKDLNITLLTTQKRMIRAVEISEYLKTNTKLPIQQPIRALIYVLTLPRDQVMARIIIRLKDRLENGMIEEVRSLLDNGLTPEQLLYYGLEYRWVTLFVLGEMSYDDMFERLNISIRQFAKRQMTWFRRMEKKGYELRWLDGNDEFDSLVNRVVAEFKGYQTP